MHLQLYSLYCSSYKYHQVFCCYEINLFFRVIHRFQLYFTYILNWEPVLTFLYASNCPVLHMNHLNQLLRTIGLIYRKLVKQRFVDITNLQSPCLAKQTGLWFMSIFSTKEMIYFTFLSYLSHLRFRHRQSEILVVVGVIQQMSINMR